MIKKQNNIYLIIIKLIISLFVKADDANTPDPIVKTGHVDEESKLICTLKL